MQVLRTEIETKLQQAASKLVDEAAAKYMATETVEAHLRKSPRSNPLKSTIGDITASIGKEPIQYTVDLPSFVSIDFKGQGPLVYLQQVHDQLAKRATTNGMAMVAFTNSKSMHTLHTWVQGLAKRGLLAIAVCNGGPRSVVPFNGTEGLFGTNPIAYGLPGRNGDIFCVDMATSEIPYFEILDAQKENKPLKEQSAVDKLGEFTTDANAALDPSVSKADPTSNIVPMGAGYKGYYMVYLMEMLTSALIGMPSSPEMSSDFVAEEHGAVLMAFSPTAMGTAESFQQTVDTLHAALKSQKPKSGKNIRIPGEENSKRLAHSGDTIEITDELLEKLDELIA